MDLVDGFCFFLNGHAEDLIGMQVSPDIVFPSFFLLILKKYYSSGFKSGLLARIISTSSDFDALIQLGA